MDTVEQKLKELGKWRQQLNLGGGIVEIEKQHRKGKLTARERIEKLLDPDSFQEIELQVGSLETGFDIDNEVHPGDGVIIGYGEVNGRPVFVWAQDATVLKGTLATVHARKIVMIMEKALQARIPIVGMVDSEGARAEDAIQYHRFFSPERMSYMMVTSSGVIPQIMLVMGPCTGEMALCAQLADFVFLVRKTSYMHVASPPPGMTSEGLGDPWIHAKTTGCYDVFAENDDDCLKKCRDLLGYLPASNEEKPPLVNARDDPNRCEQELLELVPSDGSKPYDMRKLISLIADKGEGFFEIRRHWAPNLLAGFIGLGGQTTGLLANNPQDRGGCMTLDAADKMARFVRFCDAFNIPLLWIADCPAFLPAVEEESRGLIRHGARMISANSEATVARITLVLRKYWGGGSLAMPSLWLMEDMLISWPQMERGLMNPEAATAIIYKRELSTIADGAQRAKQQQLRVTEMSNKIALLQAESTQVYIDPRETRPFLIKAFRTLRNKKQESPARKHENFRV